MENPPSPPRNRNFLSAVLYVALIVLGTLLHLYACAPIFPRSQGWLRSVLSTIVLVILPLTIGAYLLRNRGKVLRRTILGILLAFVFLLAGKRAYDRYSMMDAFTRLLQTAEAFNDGKGAPQESAPRTEWKRPGKGSVNTPESAVYFLNLANRMLHELQRLADVFNEESQEFWEAEVLAPKNLLSVARIKESRAILDRHEKRYRRYFEEAQCMQRKFFAEAPKSPSFEEKRIASEQFSQARHELELAVIKIARDLLTRLEPLAAQQRLSAGPKGEFLIAGDPAPVKEVNEMFKRLDELNAKTERLEAEQRKRRQEGLRKARELSGRCQTRLTSGRLGG